MFNLNREYKLRDEILEPFSTEEIGGLRYFKNLDLDTLKKLIDLNFIDLNGRQNLSPSVKQFLEFMEENPQTKAHGYSVSNKREDYRVTLEGVTIYKTSVKGEDIVENISEELMNEFDTRFENADTLIISKDLLYCWWD